MTNSMKSPSFEKALKEAPIEKEGLGDKIAFLRQCGVSEENLQLIAGASEENRDHLLSVLGNNPSSTEIDIANNYLNLAKYQMEIEMEGENKVGKRVSRLVFDAANDILDFPPQRTYGGKGAPQTEQDAA